MVKDNPQKVLTSAEMGKLWAVYAANTMAKCILTYFLNHVKDDQIKKVLDDALILTNSILESVLLFFEESNFPVPVGFTDKDVNLNAPRLFQDDFYLYYLSYVGKAGMSIYHVAIPMMTRKDIRSFFIDTLTKTANLMAKVNDALEAKGLLRNSPEIPTPDDIDFIDSQSYLTGFFGNKRTLHGLEIGHLFANINNDETSKALLVAFSQVAKDPKVKKYFVRGKNLNQRHISAATEKLNHDNLPAPGLLEHLVTDSTEPPFSDRMMLFHKIDMFSMKIRTYANGASLNGRRDVGAMYAKFLLDVSLYVEDGVNIMIDNNWMEQPPQAADRENLSSD
ncbi:DUF3231 family protein [Oceanobacillus senegalensis]|uniref:DUF3231 family protein n=1 Tax=Oceanobacillus senegalensis TaxID=1936063 RepID=UPI000A304149|nr:DUF3231 family protein [Oceanobacillus senegalensis]